MAASGFFKNAKVRFDVQGVLAPVFTPIDYITEHVNLNVIPDYVEYLYSQRVQGILVGGTTGEAALLNLSERKSLLETWVEACQPLNIKVISQVGGQPLPDVIELAKFSEELGADAIMTLPELYYKPRSVDQLVSYLEIVSNAAPSLPIIFYHFPMMSGVDLNMQLFYSTAKEKVPNFRGMKADLNVAVQVTDMLLDDHQIFMANHHLAPSATMGYVSSIATVTNLFPSLVFEIVESVKRGAVVEARQAQVKMNRLVDAITSQGDFLPSMKAAMEIVTGIKVGPPRKPLTPLSEEQIQRMEKRMNVADFRMYN